MKFDSLTVYSLVVVPTLLDLKESYISRGAM